MSESSSIILQSAYGSASISDLVSTIGGIIGAASAIMQSVENAECEANVDALKYCDSYKQMATSNTYYSILPAMIVPARMSAPPLTLTIMDFVRHGILVKTSYKDVYVYIGGISKDWRGKVSRLTVYQGGASFTFSGDLDTLKSLTVEDFPIAMIPLHGSTKSKFVNPPCPKCRLTKKQADINAMTKVITEQVGGSFSDFLLMLAKGLKSASPVTVAIIPNYVPYILKYIYEDTLGYNQIIPIFKSSDGQYYIRGAIHDALKTISSRFPVFNFAVSFGLGSLSQYEGLYGVTIFGNGLYSSLCSVTNPILNNVTGNLRLALMGETPLIFGAPIFDDGVCTTYCTGSYNLEGFLSPSSPASAVGSVAGTTLQLSLVTPPPNSYSIQDLEAYAQWLGIVENFRKLLSVVIKVSAVVSALVSVYNMEEEVAEDIINSLDWLGKLFENDVDTIARKIYDEVNSGNHDESSHTDDEGRELHNAYMCARFGICG
ncbi:MAG: hypothetical protein RXQ76_07230 [Acidianus sp.]